MRAVSYRGELVAVATRARVYLAPEVAALPIGHPKLRFVAAMCMYSHDVDNGEIPGPYRDWCAELYTRCVLIPDEEFDVVATRPDEDVARHFGVPVEQIAAKRGDVRTSPEAQKTRGPGLNRRDL